MKNSLHANLNNRTIYQIYRLLSSEEINWWWFYNYWFVVIRIRCLKESVFFKGITNERKTFRGRFPLSRLPHSPTSFLNITYYTTQEDLNVNSKKNLQQKFEPYPLWLNHAKQKIFIMKICCPWFWKIFYVWGVIWSKFYKENYVLSIHLFFTMH